VAEYTIREEKRGALEETLDSWLVLEGIQHLEVCRKRGNQHSKITDSEIDADELDALGSGEAVLDRVLDQVAGMGGRMELRLRFQDYAKSGGKSDLTKAFHLVRVREPATKSQGSSAATEQLATSLASAFDQQAARAESRDQRFTDFMSSMMGRSDEQGERRLSEHASYQMEIMRLQNELSRRDMQIALIENSSTIPPEVWVEMLKSAMPIVGDVVSSAKTAITAWGSSFNEAAPAITEPAAAPAPAQ